MRILRAFGVFLVTALLYLGVALLGWYLGGQRGFFSDLPRAAYAAIVPVFSLLVGVQSYSSMQGIQDSPGQAGKRVRRQTVVGAALVILLYAGMLGLPFTGSRGLWTFPAIRALAWLGVVLCAAGYGLIFWSGLALGRQYSAEVTIQKDHHLITTGPYRVVRHPRYTGILCLAAGLTLLFHAWAGVMLTAAALALIFFRIADEERLLSQEFGEEWQEYARRTHRLVPFLV